MTALLQIPGECDSERILKIGQHLTKLFVDYVGLLFLAHPVGSLCYILAAGSMGLSSFKF